MYCLILFFILIFSFFFFFNDTATTEIYTLSLHDALPICIQGTGLVKVKLHRPVEGEIKTVTIKRDVNHWYVCFSVERDSVALAESSEDIGMDVGLYSFVALSNGM